MINKSDLLIVTPSKDRAVEIQKHTLSFLQYTEFDYKIFVEPQDYGKYIAAGVPAALLVNIFHDDLGLAYCKNFIYKYALAKGFKYIFKIDDDIRALRHVSYMGKGRKYSAAISKPEKCKLVIDARVRQSLLLFEAESGVGGVSLLYDRFMYGKNAIQQETWKLLNKRFESNYICKIEYFNHGEEYSKLKGVFEDFYTFLNIIAAGEVTVTYGLAGFDVCWVGLNAGGHQSFDRRIAANKEKQFIEKRFPGVIWKKVDKGWDFEPDFRATMKNFK